MAVVLLDCLSFDGIFNTLGVIPELSLAGIPPYVVRRGDDISAALRRPYSMPDLAEVQEVEAHL